jgi:hypothetical protein
MSVSVELNQISVEIEKKPGAWEKQQRKGSTLVATISLKKNHSLSPHTVSISRGHSLLTTR